MDKKNRRAAGGVAAVVLLVLVVMDVLTPGAVIALSPLYALGPVAACVALGPRQTGLVAAVAVALAVVSGLWNGDASTAQHLVRVLDVALISGASVVVASVRTRQELRLTRLTVLADVAQRAVLPVVPRHVRSTDVAVRYQSAAVDTVMGGDLYDCYNSATHTRFLLGDVRGKGIQAVEQAARVIRAFRQAAALQPNLVDVAEEMNAYLASFFDEEEFVTAVLIDSTETGRPRMINAGHPPPLLIHPDGTSEFIETDADLPLGLGWRYSQHEFTWEPGDRLLVYTDGVSEARDRDGEFLDLRILGPQVVGRSVDAALDLILQRVRAHSLRGELTDDIAVMMLEHTGDEVEAESAPAGRHTLAQPLL
ncbi:serine/threonine-protein phosphatase [Nocardioides sp. Y6]|uniref:Serine/threonine-protein phosphatase n=1 Tax=Nocardioides malaquae TaxID=2773426 RepID=A0ABR9RR11_9ACTN|nr:PP2C family protein-serine/threonine phosphatase [Nocardioides malaquae]MBE7324008.1 serine/threonine-protein phosphatase [Nocardioides malaquae]